VPRDVKRARRYRSTLRRDQAEATRHRILDAAQQSFEGDGYTATTMAAIADAAGVSLKTVYLAFATKSGVVRALWNLRLRGDEEAVPVGERPWFRAVIDERDPARKLDLNIANARRVRERLGGLLRVIRDAASVEPEIAELWERIQREFYDNQRAVVADLHRHRSLRRGLGVDRGTDILWTLNHPDVYLLLVDGCGWTPAEHQKWLADLIRAQLLRPPV
jgi:AcrR family transcriptional regulator